MQLCCHAQGKGCCFEVTLSVCARARLCVKVADHWQQLMLKMEDRLKLVNASVAFYKTSEQVHMSRMVGRLRGCVWRRIHFGWELVSGLQRVGKPGTGVQERGGLVWWS